MYCVGIYYFIVLFTTFDVRCIIKWVVKIDKEDFSVAESFIFENLTVNALRPQIIILKQSFLHVYIIRLKNNHLGKGKILAQDMVRNRTSLIGNLVCTLKVELWCTWSNALLLNKPWALLLGIRIYYKWKPGTTSKKRILLI